MASFWEFVILNNPLRHQKVTVWNIFEYFRLLFGDLQFKTTFILVFVIIGISVPNLISKSKLSVLKYSGPKSTGLF